jgi:type I restriction enzyme M protein
MQEAMEAVEYEPEENEKVTAAIIKNYLKSLIDDLKGSAGDSAVKGRKSYQEQFDTIVRVENRIKKLKAEFKERQAELALKLSLKRLGAEEEKAETEVLIHSIDEQLEDFDPTKKAEQRKINALNKNKETLADRLARIDSVMKEIGGQLTPEGAKTLILKKLYDLANEQLTRYLNAEKRALIAVVENLWDKYAVSVRELEVEREKTLAELNGFLGELGYWG